MNWSQWVTLFSGSLAILFNILLIPVILLYSSDKIGNYKYCLLLYTLSGAVMTICQVNTLAAWWAPVNGYLFFSTVSFHPLWLQTCFIYGLVAGYAFNLIVICWSFMIRYSILTGESLLSFGQLKKSIRLAIGSLILWALLMVFMEFISRREETTAYFEKEILDVHGVDLETVGYIGAAIMIDGLPNWHVFTCVGFYSVFFGIITAVISTYWYKIRRRLKQLRNLHPSSFRVQYRLYTLLTFQALLPLIFNTSPVCLAFFAGITQISVGILITICGSILSFAQILDPILTITLISDYRRGVLGLFRIKQRRVTDAVTASGGFSNSHHSTNRH